MLDLQHWSGAFNGAEPSRPASLERFAAAFRPYGFRRVAWLPCYGLAEATLLVSGGQASLPLVVRSFQGTALGHNQLAKRL